MDSGSGGGVDGAAASSSSSTLLCGGGRQRFEVELRPGETTIVSWKKLIKDANRPAKKNSENKELPVSVPPVSLPVAANPALDSRIAPPSGDTAENEANDAPPGSRFSAVIEKIERLYMGKNSSDEEDLNDVPHDDEYDTEDSFIDDTELDEYFQVDNSAIKHDGFFVNRGKLERTNEEPTSLPTEQPKKRRRKDSTKVDGGSKEGNVPNKLTKINKKESKKVLTSTPSRSITLPNANIDDARYQSPIIALGSVLKKPLDPKSITNPSPTKVINGETRVPSKNIEKQKAGILQSKKVIKTKDGSPSSQRVVVDKAVDVQSKSQVQVVNNLDVSNQSVTVSEKSIIHQHADTKVSEISPQPQKNLNMLVRKEGSSIKAKSTTPMLEKAIRDLEKIVAETRPPSTSIEVPEADNSSQAVKRRMPPEIKQKLAKVARLAHAIHGKLSKELINRLMTILGHLIQLRSLKRNLHNMIIMGLSAKEKKDSRLQQLKKEVDEMVKIRAPMMKKEIIEQPAGSSDDFQDTSKKEKVVKYRFTTDDALEDKICDLYDFYVEGLDEDLGPQVRKLYAELAQLWPEGFMDNHGIKRAICRAKDRRKQLFRRQDQDSLKRRKLLGSKTEALTIDGGSTGQVQRAPDKPPVTDSISAVRSISNTLAAAAAANTTDKPKQEKLKSSSNNQNDTTKASEVLVKKKVKRKPDAEVAAGQLKSTSGQGEEKRKTIKPIMVSGGLEKPAAESTVTLPTLLPPPAGVQPTEPTINKSADVA